jgi:hypothetical protein
LYVKAYFECIPAHLNLLDERTRFSQVLTGVVGVMLCPVGVSCAFDIVHYAASALYMLDHFVLLSYFGVSWPYCAGFFTSLALFFGATHYLDTVLVGIGIDSHGQ